MGFDFHLRLLRLLCLLVAGASVLQATYWIPEIPPLCGVEGYRLRPAYAIFVQQGLLNATQCGAACLAETKCRSFSLTRLACRLYDHDEWILPWPKFHAYYERMCVSNRFLCNVRGTPRFPTYKQFGPSPIDSSWTGCQARCAADIRCQTFSLGPAGLCRLYRQRVADALDMALVGRETYWDPGCQFVINGD
ncbi:hypothetical protein E4U41_004880, partial [Claviceps citrina]